MKSPHQINHLLLTINCLLPWHSHSLKAFTVFFRIAAWLQLLREWSSHDLASRDLVLLMLSQPWPLPLISASKCIPSKSWPRGFHSGQRLLSLQLVHRSSTPLILGPPHPTPMYDLPYMPASLLPALTFTAPNCSHFLPLPPNSALFYPALSSHLLKSQL